MMIWRMKALRMNKGTLFIFSAPSGTGKFTVLKRILNCFSYLKYSISATTRQPRDCEQDSVHYYFYTKEHFMETLNNDGFLEHTKYIDNYYGTPKKPVFKWLDEGYDVILEIEVDGAKKIKTFMPEAVSIFMLPPSKEELLNRLKKADTGLRNDIELRYSVAIEEMKQAYFYDYVVINDDLENAVLAVKSIIIANRQKADNMGKIIDGVIGNVESEYN